MVKHAAGWFIQPQTDATSRREPRRLWIHRTMLAAIRDGRLAPGTRLPSARQIAAEWGVTRGAVDEAFAQLQSEGLVARRVGAGSHVCAVLPPDLRAPAAPVIRALSATARGVLERLGPLLAAVLREGESSASGVRYQPTGENR